MSVRTDRTGLKRIATKLRMEGRNYIICVDSEDETDAHFSMHLQPRVQSLALVGMLIENVIERIALPPQTKREVMTNILKVALDYGCDPQKKADDIRKMEEE